MRLKYIIFLLCLAGLGFQHQAAAQSAGSNSTYSRYGMGLLKDQTNSYNRAMGGVSQALRSSNRINFTNPASNSAVDSLTFLFDLGMNMQRTRMVQGTQAKGVNNTSFDFATAGFRLRRGLGMSLGFTSYTDIGYTFSQETPIGEDLNTGSLITSPSTYTGEGGLHLAFMGVGWEAFKGFSIGANVGLLWGTIGHSMTSSFSQDNTTTSTDASIVTTYYSSLLTWKADIGLQYQTLLNATNRLTLGGTVGIGHPINREATYASYTNSNTLNTLTASDAFELPMSYHFGVAWEHAERLMVAADVNWEQWGNCKAPEYNKATSTYAARTGLYKDRWRVNFGAEYVPARYDSHYLQRINYRIGAFYSTPYLMINGIDGPREIGLTAGLGLPIQNSINNRSYVNVGLQWTHRAASASTLITENVMSINIGITFNERWFMKWKFK